MKRVILHWTGGPHKATGLDKQHYHFIYEADGTVVVGIHPIGDNKSPIDPKNYAAHTKNCNSDSIGLSVACMLGAIEGKSLGSHPMTETQLEAMCKDTARFCKLFGIPVTNKTVLTHAEVQENLGIKQAGKWDIAVIPFKPELKGAKACGDYIRTRVQSYMQPDVPKPATVKPQPIAAAKPTSVWQWLKSLWS